MYLVGGFNPYSMWMYNDVYMFPYIIWLVVQFHHLEKWWSESQWGWDDIPYMKWKIQFMFQIPNHQPVYIAEYCHKWVFIYGIHGIVSFMCIVVVG